MADAAKKRATYADLEAVPPHLVGEIIDGELMTHPRPSLRHAVASSVLGYELIGPFHRGVGGPGGWIFVDEPKLHLNEHVLVPDMAGWRRERMPFLPEKAFFELPPDWLCEVLSASTELRDRTVKMRAYAGARIPHLWIIDPRQQRLEAFGLRDGLWLQEGAWSGDDQVSAPPFDAVSFSLADLWPLDRPLGLNEDPQHLYVGDR